MITRRGQLTSTTVLSGSLVAGNVGVTVPRAIVQRTLPRWAPSLNVSPDVAAAATGVTWNPADKSGTVTLSNGNLTAATAASTNNGVRSTTSKSTGVVAYEVTIGAGQPGFGIANGSVVMAGFTGGAALVLNQNSTGTIGVWDQATSTNAGTGAADITVGDIWTVVVDLTNLKFYALQNGVNRIGNYAAGTGGLAITAASGPWFAFYDSQGYNPENLTAKFTGLTYKPAGVADWQPPVDIPILITALDVSSPPDLPTYDVTAGSPDTAIDITALDVGSPDALTLSPVTQDHVIVITAKTVSSPTLPTFVATQAQVIVLTALAIGSPSLPTATATQRHTIIVTALTTASPVLPTPSVTQVQTIALTALAVTSPALPSFVVTQAHVVSPAALATSSPSLPSLAVTQAHVVIVTALATASPALPTLVEGESTTVTLTSLSISSPAIGWLYEYAQPQGLYFIASGTFASGTTAAITPALPVGWTTGDLLILLVETANQPVSTPTGWTDSGGNAGTGTAGTAGAVRLQVFYKFAASNETAPTVGPAGSQDHITAQMQAFRGVNPATPMDATPVAGTLAPATDISIPGITTVTEDAVVITCLATDGNAANNFYYNWYDPNLAGGGLGGWVLQLSDQGAAVGTGGGVAAAFGVKIIPGATGDIAGSQINSAAIAYITIALRRATPTWYHTGYSPTPDYRYWTPKDLTGGVLIGWWDFSDASTITTGATWSIADKSPSGATFSQTTAANQPVVQTNGWNGKQVAAFDGHVMNLSNNSLNSVDTAAGRASIIASVWPGNVNNGAPVLGLRGNSPIMLNASWANGISPTNWGMTLSPAHSYNYVNGPPAALAPHVIGVSFPSSGPYSAILTKDGVDNTEVDAVYPTYTDNTPSANFIGLDNGFASRVFGGRIGEIILIKGELSSSDKAKLEGYLAYKWFTPLPVAHPYYSAPPLVAEPVAVISSLAVGSPTGLALSPVQQVQVFVTGLATASPTLPSLTATQVHAVHLTALAISSPSLPTATVTQVQVIAATPLTTASPSLPTAAVTQAHVVLAAPLAVGRPALPTLVATQAHLLSPQNLATSSPTLPTFVATQVHTVSITQKAITSPTFPTVVVTTPGIVGFVPFATSSPTLPTPAITQAYPISLKALATGSPSLGSLVATQASVIAVSPLAVSSPTIPTVTVTQVHVVAVAPLVVAAPAIQPLVLTSITATIFSLAVGPPTFNPLAVGQSSQAQIQGLVVAQPSLSLVTATLAHNIIISGIDVSPLNIPAISVFHRAWPPRPFVFAAPTGGRPTVVSLSNYRRPLVSGPTSGRPKIFGSIRL